MDPTPDGKISSEDAAAITSGVLQDNDMLKDYLTDYYVKAMEQNFYDSLSPDVREATQVKQNLEKKHKSPTTGLAPKPQTGFRRELKVRGGVIRDGIYIPNEK